MTNSFNAPERLSVVDGVLKMRDGSSVRKYLRGKPVDNQDAVVILARAGYDSLVRDALQWRLHQERLMAHDERFPIAA